VNHQHTGGLDVTQDVSHVRLDELDVVGRRQCAYPGIEQLDGLRSGLHLGSQVAPHDFGEPIVVELIPAGTRRERAAFVELLRPINARKLSLPGDPARRPLRFNLQLEGDEPM
jgi:hypothetical protein